MLAEGVWTRTRPIVTRPSLPLSALDPLLSVGTEGASRRCASRPLPLETGLRVESNYGVVELLSTLSLALPLEFL